MSSEHIFISHASADDNFVKELRLALEGQGLTVWVDSRNLLPGQRLEPEIERAIETARQVIVVLSKETVNSAWVRKEVQKAQAVEKRRKDGGYRVIPLLLEGLQTTALGNWFDEEPLAIPIELSVGGLSQAMAGILTALGIRLPEDRQEQQVVEALPVEDLILELEDPKILEAEGKRRAQATATLIYESANSAEPPVRSKRFNFTAPLGPIEAEDLQWYLESYYRWPTGLFKERAERIEAQLPQWGKQLYQAALNNAESAKNPLSAWQSKKEKGERRFSILVNSELPEGTAEELANAAKEAGSTLLSLPWELMHDERTYLFSGGYPVRVRRRLPNYLSLGIGLAELPIRILLVSPRPENKQIDYIDHRISALPLVTAVEDLGKLAELTILTPPTYHALGEALRLARQADKPFDVVHFDGHGVYDPKLGLGGLCFEDPQDATRLYGRNFQIITAEQMAQVCRDYRIPLVFLEACQSAKAEEDPSASVAGKLLEEGVTSVVAMSYSVLVETARRFVEAFYGELARGTRVGAAMLAGQRVLKDETYRMKIVGAGELHLQDWFVPVLYQEEQDPQLFTYIPPKRALQIQGEQRRLSLGALPDTPKHAFIGRSRELLALERLLLGKQSPALNYAVLVGQGGEGKTTLAVELARWLVRTNRFRRTAFVSVEHYNDVRGVLDRLGKQLLPEGDKWSVANYGNDLKAARLPIERALRDHPTVIVVDNLESVLPAPTGETPPETEPAEKLFELCQTLLRADDGTRVLFTSRESIREDFPFGHANREIRLGALSRDDAVELVSRVMEQKGLVPEETDPGKTPQEITDLVDAVNRHARALVLLAREVARRGVRSTTENLHQLMAGLHKKHRDERENSLYASVELSLRRLSPKVRQQIQTLGVFHGGANLWVLSQMLDIDINAVALIAVELQGVGLGTWIDYRNIAAGQHLRLDPGLSPYLLEQMDDDEAEAMRAKWADRMTQLTEVLYGQFFKDTELAAQLTLLELPNLLETLKWAQAHRPAEQVVSLATKVEELVSRLGRPQSLAQVVAMREVVTQQLGAWSHERFEAERAAIERKYESGDLRSALDAAKKLLQHVLKAGEAQYDIAMAHMVLGRTTRLIGASEAALEPLGEARGRFQILADAGNNSAAGMVGTTINERADCLRDLGRYDEAATAYQEAISIAKKLNKRRSVAVSKIQLGTLRLLQKRYAEALELYTEAKDTFETLNEPNTVATIWHQIGMTYRELDRFDPAEDAYRQALAIKVQQTNRPSEALTLTELGNLYDGAERLEEAVRYYQQAADIHVELGDEMGEGIDRYNLGRTFARLERYDEARREFHRAIECKEPYGHAAAPWRTWEWLRIVEEADGNSDAAAKARGKGIETYRAYRRAGGGSHEWSAQICAAVAQEIETGDIAEAEQILASYLGPDADPLNRIFIPKLQAVLLGSRDLMLAQDPELNYQDAAELQLLLETLGA